MFALCHSIQTGISIPFTVFVAILKKFWELTFLRVMQAYPADDWYAPSAHLQGIIGYYMQRRI